MATIPLRFEEEEEARISSNNTQQNVQIKKKRNLPGMPDPDAEVIALSPKTLLATNRFVCEICNKGFQRDQNLQLHRRGHNLPWKLRQRSGDEVIRKRVYVCPETSCVHHDPARALGDLTGVKKHFCRKHGEKKWKCERCSKKYAVVSDWKAHMKTCGTREYRCDCGTLFSRRDSFITHRAFCDALAQESARSHNLPITNVDEEAAPPQLKEVVDVTTAGNTTAPSTPPTPPLTPSTVVLSPVMSVHTSDLPENNQTPGGLEQPKQQQQIAPQHSTTTSTTSSGQAGDGSGGGTSSSSSSGKLSNNNIDVMASVHGASASIGLTRYSNAQSFSGFMNMDHHGSAAVNASEPVSLSLSSPFYINSNMNLPLFPSSTPYQPIMHYPTSAISATALLQKAAQMGATSTGSSFLRSLGLSMPTSSSSSSVATPPSFGGWMDDVKLENSSSTSGFRPNVYIRSTEIMMSSVPPPTMADVKPTTVDFLGLGNSHGGASSSSTGRFSSYLKRVGIDGFDAGGVNMWDDEHSSDMKPTL